MRIIQIHNHWKVAGGADRVFIDTIELLTHKGHTVNCVSSTDVEKTIYVGGNLIIPNPNNVTSKGFLTSTRKVRDYIYSTEIGKEFESYIRIMKPDIVHLHIVYGVLSNSIIHVLNKYNIKTVMTVHDFKMLCPAYLFIDGQSRICEKCASGNYLHSIWNKCSRDSYLLSTISAVESTYRDLLYPYEETIDHFIFVSEFSRNKHIQYNSRFKSNSSVLNNFTDPGKYEGSKRGGGQRYLYIGRLSREKGIQTLLKAFSDLHGMEIVLAGSGPLASRVSNYAMKYSNIKYLGFIEMRRLVPEILKSKFTILGSECYENNPLSIMESFSLGVPVIGADIGGIPEMVKHNKNGLLFRSGDISSLKDTIRMSAKLSNYEYFRMQEKSKTTYIKKYSVDVHYKNLISIYKHVIAG